MKRRGKAVGVWPLMTGYVELRYDRNVCGGEFSLWSPDKGVPYILVGGSEGRNSWAGVVGVFAHETFEYAMTHRGLRFFPSPDLAGSHAGYIFHMQHEQFAEVASEAGSYMALALPLLEKAWAFENKKNK